jgi:hypothetical protein
MKIRYKQPYWIKFRWDISEKPDDQYVTQFNKSTNDEFISFLHNNSFVISTTFKIGKTFERDDVSMVYGNKVQTPYMVYWFRIKDEYKDIPSSKQVSITTPEDSAKAFNNLTWYLSQIYTKKDNYSNIVTLCSKCHDKIDTYELIINGWIETSNGRQLDYYNQDKPKIIRHSPELVEYIKSLKYLNDSKMARIKIKEKYTKKISTQTIEKYWVYSERVPAYNNNPS